MFEHIMGTIWEIREYMEIVIIPTGLISRCFICAASPSSSLPATYHPTLLSPHSPLYSQGLHALGHACLLNSDKKAQDCTKQPTALIVFVRAWASVPLVYMVRAQFARAPLDSWPQA